jgi:hypothetical protein
MSLQLTDKANEQNICTLPACNQTGNIDVSNATASFMGLPVSTVKARLHGHDWSCGKF